MRSGYFSLRYRKHWKNKEYEEKFFHAIIFTVTYFRQVTALAKLQYNMVRQPEKQI